MKTLMLALLALGLVLASGCGGPPAGVQQSLTATARGLVAADANLAPAYGAQADTCREHSASWEEYDACMVSWNRAEAAMRASKEALRVAQAGHDAWDEGTDDGATWAAAVPCLVTALSRLLGWLAQLRVPIPPILTEGFRMAERFGGGCG